MARAVVTIGIGFGDEGKGAMVDALCQHVEADLVVRYCGGCQAAHHVTLPNGRSHCFSQWGSGTFRYIPTWLWEDMIIDPLAMVCEAKHLIDIDSTMDPWSLLMVHPECPVVTSVHRYVNRRKETERGDQRHGSCGMGIGECRDMLRRYPEATILARHLPWRNQCRTKYMKQCEILEIDPSTFDIERELDIFETVPERWSYSRAPFKWRRPESVVFEGAQGVLLDENVGFHPYTTWSTVTLQAARDPLQVLKITDVHNLGITRTMATRHGAGPLPSCDERLKLPTDHNRRHDWQGDFRVGYLDDLLLRYAAKNCGGTLDSIAVTWMDAMPAMMMISPPDFDLETLPNDGTRAARLFEYCGRLHKVGPAEMLTRIESACGAKISCLSFGPSDGKVLRI